MTTTTDSDHGFPAGTLVRRADGAQQRIEATHVLDELLTAEGSVQPVLKVSAHPSLGNLTAVRLWGHPPLTCAPQQALLTQRGYIPALALTVGEYVGLTKYLPHRTSTIRPAKLVDLLSFSKGARAGRTVAFTQPNWALAAIGGESIEVAVAGFPKELPLSRDLGRLLGLYAAEGNTTINKVVWSFGGHEEHTLVPETVHLVASALGGEARVQVRPNRSINVVLYGKHWRLLFEALVPGTSKHGNKHLSNHVTAGGPDFLQAVLDGWYAGDGHIRKSGSGRESREGITVCMGLAMDMHAIAVALGYRPALQVNAPSLNRHAATRQNRWSLTCPLQLDGLPDDRPGYCRCGCGEATTWSRSRGFQNEYKNGHYLAAAAKYRQDDNHLWRRVRGIAAHDHAGNYVFALRLAGTSTHVAAGIGVAGSGAAP